MTLANRAIIFTGFASIAATLVLSILPGMQFGDAWIRNTARIALLWYWAAILSKLIRNNPASPNLQDFDRATRWFWTWGAIVYLIHVLVAFHFYHHWSHAKAFDHVAHASRFGEGIYVSYFFTVLWTVDAGWWWASPQSYVQRPVWISRMIHVFMLFIVVNATMIFETGIVRIMGAAMLASFALAIAWRLTHRKTN
jgi:hypothetical protein